MMFKNYFFFLSFIFLTHCVSPPKVDLKTDIPDKWRNTLPAQKQETHNESWWKNLQDETLNKTVALAIEKSLSLAQVKERLQSARALEAYAIANQKPKVSLYAGPDSTVRYLQSDVSTASALSAYRRAPSYLAGFDLAWELPFLGKSESELLIARSELTQATAMLELAKMTLITDVIRVYGALRTEQAVLRLMQKIEKNQADLVSKMTKGLALGAVSQKELALTNVHWVDAKKMFSAQKVTVETLLQQLSVLCGENRSLSMWENQIDWQIAYPQVNQPEVPVELILKRPDVKSAEAQVLKAAGEVGVAKRELYPKFGVQGAFMVAGHLGKGNRSSSIIQFLSPYVTFPLLDWGANRQIVNQKESFLQESIFNYREVVLKAIAETEIAIAQFNEIAEQKNKFDQNAQLSKRPQLGYQRGRELGYVSDAETLTQENMLLLRQITQEQLRAEWLMAFVALHKVQMIF